MKRLVIALLLLLLTGCIGSIETTAHMNRRLVAAADEQERRYALSDCRVTYQSTDSRGLSTMRCTMGKGTRWEVKNVFVFAAYVPEDAAVCR